MKMESEVEENIKGNVGCKGPCFNNSLFNNVVEVCKFGEIKVEED
jgi:hypothetical protein